MATTRVLLTKASQWLQLDVNIISVPNFILFLRCLQFWTSPAPFYFVGSLICLIKLTVQYNISPGARHWLCLRCNYTVWSCSPCLVSLFLKFFEWYDFSKYYFQQYMDCHSSNIWNSLQTVDCGTRSCVVLQIFVFHRLQYSEMFEEDISNFD